MPFFDECHYFSSDALFSDTSDRLLWSIPMIFRESIRIYMTATVNAVLPLICAAEYAWRVPLLCLSNEPTYISTTTHHFTLPGAYT